MRERLDVVTTSEEVRALEPEWYRLLARSAADEPTKSPLWLGAWWHVFGGGTRSLRVVTVRHDGRLVGVAPLLARRYAWDGGIPFRRLELLGCGEDESDEVCSDFTGVIAERGHECSVATRVVEAVCAGELGGWDEIVLDYADLHDPAQAAFVAAVARAGVDVVAPVRAPAPLAELPATWDDYVASLSRSGRYLVRRAMRDLDRWADGELALRRAGRDGSLELGFEILVQLHRERWWLEGRPGVFDSARFLAFHRRVTAALHARGALDLVWLEARGHPVAALYNILWGGQVYFYQSGRAHLDDRLRPGIAIHGWAIRDAIDRGARRYNFLAGRSRYKRQLSTTGRTIHTVRATRPGAISETARRIARGARNTAGRVLHRLRHRNAAI